MVVITKVEYFYGSPCDKHMDRYPNKLNNPEHYLFYCYCEVIFFLGMLL